MLIAGTVKPAKPHMGLYIVCISYFIVLRLLFISLGTVLPSHNDQRTCKSLQVLGRHQYLLQMLS